MQTITCPHCKKSFEITHALQREVVEKALEEEKEKFEKELKKMRYEERIRLEKKLKDELDLTLRNNANEIEETKDRFRKLQNEMLVMIKEKRELEEKTQRAELDMQKKLNEESVKLKDQIGKIENEKANLKIAEIRKQLDDTQKALEDAKRKSDQVSQQLQGEVLELELEELLRGAFPHDEIIPIAKGVHGADLRQVVKSPRGFICGVILWEFKRTKKWDEKWIDKLKSDLRSENANVPVIVSLELPKGMQHIGLKDGVWIVSQSVVLPLAELLRKNLLDIGYQKVIAGNRTEKAEILYTYITSHEFQQQVELLVEVFTNMQDQIIRERIAFEKQWKLRESQIHKLVSATANIIGSMQGKVGASMPQIKGLDLLEE